MARLNRFRQTATQGFTLSASNAVSAASCQRLNQLTARAIDLPMLDDL
jgi:hypothetical protein